MHSSGTAHRAQARVPRLTVVFLSFRVRAQGKVGGTCSVPELCLTFLISHATHCFGSIAHFVCRPPTPACPLLGVPLQYGRP